MNFNEKVSVACASIEAVLFGELKAKEKLILHRHLMHLALYTYEVGFNEGISLIEQDENEIGNPLFGEVRMVKKQLVNELALTLSYRESGLLHQHLRYFTKELYEVGAKEGKYEKELAEWSEQVREEVEAIFLEEFLTTEAMDKFLDGLEDIE